MANRSRATPASPCDPAEAKKPTTGCCGAAPPLPTGPPTAIGHRKRTGPASIVDRVPRKGLGGHIQSRANENVDDSQGMGELAMVASLHDSRTASGRQMGDAGHVPGAGHLRVASGRERWIVVHLRERDRYRHAVEIVSERRNTHTDTRISHSLNRPHVFVTAVSVCVALGTIASVFAGTVNLLATPLVWMGCLAILWMP